MLNRRHLLQASSMLSLSSLVPGFVSNTARALQKSPDERMLVVIELGGGNDGLNTVIPYTNENYAKYRIKLRVEASDVIKLNDSLGLHPGMKAAGELFDEGNLAIVPGVGYPNPNRSHFRSMAIWHSARLSPDDHTGQGWLGRACDVTRDAQTEQRTEADSMFLGDGTLPSAVVGRRARAVALNNESELSLVSNKMGVKPTASDASDLMSYVRDSVNGSYALAKEFAETDIGSPKDEQSSGTRYPNNRLGQHLSLVSRFMQLNLGTRIFYVAQPGYDTHSAQASTHEQLLSSFSRCLKAFLNDLREVGLADRVVVCVFSEFGRRVKENGSAGTDHGTSGPMFIAGEPVRAGILSEYPSLEELVDGDLPTTVDFRRVYASLLEQWLHIDSQLPLGGKFQPLNVIA